MTTNPEETSENILQYKEAKQTLAVVMRIAMIAVHKLGGTLRITDEEWGAAANGDVQWRTVRHPGLEPEIHVAATMPGENIQVGKRAFDA